MTDHKLKTSVIKTVAVAEVNKEGTLQTREDLKPGNWAGGVPPSVKDTSSELYKKAEAVRKSWFSRQTVSCMSRP